MSHMHSTAGAQWQGNLRIIDHVLCAQMTVQETLDMVAALRLPRNLSADERAAAVDDVLAKLDLTTVRCLDLFIYIVHVDRVLLAGPRCVLCASLLRDIVCCIQMQALSWHSQSVPVLHNKRPQQAV
jgi:hypothetical protein